MTGCTVVMELWRSKSVLTFLRFMRETLRTRTKENFIAGTFVHNPRVSFVGGFFDGYGALRKEENVKHDVRRTMGVANDFEVCL